MTVNVSSVAYVRHSGHSREYQRTHHNNITANSRQSPTVDISSTHRAVGSPGTPKQQCTSDQQSTTNNIQHKSPKSLHRRRFKLSSVLRRLSIRNFMEYCVSALNEASSSCASNRFDLTFCEDSVWFLGRQYKLPDELDPIKRDISTRVWITYRRNFPPIDGNSRYITDRGFGCMIRCGQMVLANALVYSCLGKQWRWSPFANLRHNPIEYVEILKLFQDKFSSKYSIHNIVQIGEEDGKPIGEWFGPNTIAQALKKLSQFSPEPGDHDTPICIEVALDNIVIADDIRKNCKVSLERHAESADNQAGGSSDQQELQQSWTPTLLFIPLRLGLSKINPIYFRALKKTFQFPQTLGIIGGRPNHALYMVGYVGNDIIYLDPHTTQQYIDLDELNQESPVNSLPVEDETTDDQSQAETDETQTDPPVVESVDASYHCDTPEKMPVDRLDPSLALCFYFHTEKDFEDWCEQSKTELIDTENQPMFEISQSRPSFWPKSPAKSSSRTRSSKNPNQVSTIRTGDDTEKFTVLHELGEERVEAVNDNEKNAPKDGDNPDDEEFEMLG